jgi:hypothetical protein
MSIPDLPDLQALSAVIETVRRIISGDVSTRFGSQDPCLVKSRGTYALCLLARVSPITLAGTPAAIA